MTFHIFTISSPQRCLDGHAVINGNIELYKESSGELVPITFDQISSGDIVGVYHDGKNLPYPFSILNSLKVVVLE